jgi:hypothetical protein
MRVAVSFAVAIILLAVALPAADQTVRAQNVALRDLLPAAEAVGPGFVVVDYRERTLGEQAVAFANAEDAARRLAAWGWQENAFKVFQATALTEAGAPAATLDISLTRFAAPDGAANALPYFLEDRAAVLGQQEVPTPSPLGDEARAVSGEVGTGFDTTLYVRSGPLLLRISATAAAGAPHAAPEQLARGIIDRASGLQQPAVPTGALADFLPWSSPLPDAACARLGEEDEGAVPAAMERFDGIPDAAATLAAMGWQEGVSRQFGCDDPPPDGVGWVNLGVHRFQSADAAASAVAVFAKSRAFETGLDAVPPPDLDRGMTAAAITGETVNGTEYSLYLSAGPLLFRVTGVAPAGDPRHDVIGIATALAAQEQGSLPEEVIFPTPLPTLAPAIVPTATPRPIPTEVPPPTLAPSPTATPVPTAAPLPTLPPPPPTAIPTVPPPPPTATPQSLPTATSGPPPTPTPRVIHLPTPPGD